MPEAAERPLALERAAHNRARFDAAGVLAINMISAPGSGKTALLEATAHALRDELRIAVLAGDLDAHRVQAALRDQPLDTVDVLFFENVARLAGHASLNLGQHRNVVLLSFTGDDDDPARYPVLFRAADVVLLSKSDLAAHVDEFDAARAERCLRELSSQAPVHPVSARRRLGLQHWLAWIQEALDMVRAGPQPLEIRRPAHTFPRERERESSL